MIGYICKYTPIEIFEAMGETVKRIEPNVTNFNQADTLMHPNICSFAKGLLEVAMEEHYDGIILTTCCDSIRRVYDILKEQLPDTFVYILDVPRITKDAGILLYEQRIREMVKAYETFSGKIYNEEKLDAYLESLWREQQEKETAVPKKEEKRMNVGILGARANPAIKEILEEKEVNITFDLTCTGLKRKILYDKNHLLLEYSRGLLSQFPCMRMETATNRERMLNEYLDQTDGIIYHTIQFCDNYSYEYAVLKEKMKKPLLLLETDNTTQSYGQVLTRMEAFLESLNHGESLSRKKSKHKKGKDGKMYVIGIDSGSTSTNAVVMDEKKNIVAFDVVRTGAKSGESANRVLSQVIEKAHLTREDISYIVSTGYGRVSIPFADENVTEISCHGRGAHYFNPSIRTILDIGGQDSKAIHLDENGEVTDFVMNDKCAAGTGRFLEAIARTLEVDIATVGQIALESTEDITITSMCTVFAESEVISLIANNKEKADIANGVCHSIATKAYSLMKRVGLQKGFMMTGGVAKNPGVVKAVEENIQDMLYICPEPEIVGAVGASLYALEAMTM